MKRVSIARFMVVALAFVACILPPVFAVETPAAAGADVILQLAFDEGTGNAVAATGSLARQCAIENGEWVKDGIDGSCLKLSGADSSVNLGEIALSAPFTFSCWLSPGAETPDMRLVSMKQTSKGASWGLTLNYPQAGMISQWDGKKNWCSIDPTALLSDWKWIWLVVAVDAEQKVALYCNGLKIGATTLPTKVFDANPYFFGTRFQNYGTCYKGLVDEIVFRNRALTAAEIQQMYAAECQRLKHEEGAVGPINPRKASADAGPFIRVREIVSSVPWGGWIKSDMPLELRQRYFMPFWPESRQRKHLEMLKAFGFNSIQLSLNPLMAWWVGANEQEVRKTMLFRCRTAHELGLSVSGFIWGAAIADATKGGQQFAELDWRKPEQRARLEAWYRDQAEVAPYIDRLVTHWIDAGDQRTTTVDTIVEQHNAIMAIYREKNPKIRGTLSTWFMCRQNGPIDYEGPGKLAAHPKLDRDSDVAWGGRFGAASELDAIVAAGRRVAVWGWYTADNEIQPALWVRMSVLEGTFQHNLSPSQRRRLASQWTDGLAWYSLDDNFSGLNMQNLYVAGKLMQDPSLDAQQLLDEFVQGFVGETNAPSVAAALRAVERARTLSGSYQSKVVDAVEPPSELKIAGVEMTRNWLDNTIAIVDSAIAGMKTVKLAPDFKTAWPVVMEPTEYLGELNAHLEAIRQMLAFLKGVREIEKMQATGASKEKLEVVINALPKVVYDPAHTAGLEADIFRQKLAALKKATQVPQTQK